MVAEKVVKKIKEKIKVDISKNHTCPICKKGLQIGVENRTINDYKRNGMFSHIILHGNPLHAMIVYRDWNNAVRTVECSKSIEISRDQKTFSEILRKWSNPYYLL